MHQHKYIILITPPKFNSIFFPFSPVLLLKRMRLKSHLTLSCTSDASPDQGCQHFLDGNTTIAGLMIPYSYITSTHIVVLE